MKNFRLTIILVSVIMTLYPFCSFILPQTNPVITFPSKGAVLSGTSEVNWTMPSRFPKSRAYFQITNDNKTYKTIGEDLTQTGKITFNTLDNRDGVFYKIRADVCDSNGNFWYRIYSDYFTIKNYGHAAPEIMGIYPVDKQFNFWTQEIKWLSGDVDNDPYKVNIYYRALETSQWIPIAEGLSQTDSVFQWNTENYANSENASIMFKAISLSDTSTGSFQVNSIIVRNDHTELNIKDYLKERKSYGSGNISIVKVNPSEITGHDYRIAFDSLPGQSGIVFNVTNLTTGKEVLSQGSETNGIAESGYFDGLRLIVKADTVELDESQSGFRDSKANFYMSINPNANKQFSYKLPYDYELDFIDTKSIYTWDGSYPRQGTPVNFIVKNLSTGDTSDVIVDDRNWNGIFEQGDGFIIVEFIDKNHNGINEISERKYIWDIRYGVVSGPDITEPAAGDKFFITMKKPFIKGDMITFSTKNLTGAESHSGLPDGYSLSQNYPNPFNPETMIRYSISEGSMVRLKVYDMLGREITTLVNGFKPAGHHTVQFNASLLPSGVYIYTIQAGKFRDSKKLMILR